MSRKRKTKVNPATIDDPWDSWKRYPSQIPNPDANKTEFDLRSNIGQQFGSQGTLFRVSRRPRSSPGPKGFSPERQDLVRAKTSVYADALAGLENSNGGWLDTDVDGRGMLTPKAMGRRRGAERRVQDIVSRSSAPIEGRVNVGVVHPDDKSLTSAGAAYGWASAGGVYKTFANGPHAIAGLDSVLPGDGRKKTRLYSDTLIHELGHHHSAMTNPDMDYTTPEGQGREEAFADDFSATHRPRRHRNLPNNELPYTDLGRGAGFREAYDNARTTPTSFVQAFVNPNVPGSAHSAAHREGDQGRFMKNNPTLPGMENAQDLTDRYVESDHGRLQGYESLPDHETRVLNRQTETIRKRVEAQ
jgi:hypothetical protein